MNNICFIIAHKYFRGYESYLKYYIDNIQKLYPGALALVVDNNSVYGEDIFKELEGYENVIIISNEGDSKFELGAYREGIKYMLKEELTKDYQHFVFTQDNFVLKNKYDFESMTANSCYARPINSMYADGECADIVVPVMTKLGLNNNWDKVNFCWCSSFVVEQTKIEQLYHYLNQITVVNRWQSCAGERYLARILWELNEHRDCGDIDGSCVDLAVRHYNTWNVDMYAPSTSFFVKKVQQKNENTVDSDTEQQVRFIPHEQNKADSEKGV